MRRPSGGVLLAAVAVVAVLVPDVKGLSENSVHILSKFNQLVTSTTLSWVSDYNSRDTNRPGKNAAMGATVENKLKKTEALCRAQLNGVLVPGQLLLNESPGPDDELLTCQVSLHGTVVSLAKYEVLDNIFNAARFSWVPWDRWSTTLPVGAVTTSPEIVIARQKNTNNYVSSHFIGKLTGYQSGHLTIINADDKEEEVNDGEILVEIEPIKYELAIRKFTFKLLKYVQNKTFLGETILKNSGTSPMHVDAVMDYDEQYSKYWGQQRAILKGLPTIILLPNGTLYEQIQWGIADKKKRTNRFRVQAFLEPGTAVNVSLSGNHTTTELPYEGDLVAIYEDGARSARTIHGDLQDISMEDLVATYSPAYFLGNFSLVLHTTTTTTTTPTTTSTSTTTMPTTTTTTKPTTTTTTMPTTTTTTMHTTTIPTMPTTITTTMPTTTTTTMPTTTTTTMPTTTTTTMPTTTTTTMPTTTTTTMPTTPTTTTPTTTTTLTSTTTTPASPINKLKKDDHHKEENMINDQAQSFEDCNHSAEVESSAMGQKHLPFTFVTLACLTALLIRIT